MQIFRDLQLSSVILCLFLAYSGSSAPVPDDTTHNATPSRSRGLLYPAGAFPKFAKWKIWTNWNNLDSHPKHDDEEVDTSSYPVGTIDDEDSDETYIFGDCGEAKVTLFKKINQGGDGAIYQGSLSATFFKGEVIVKEGYNPGLIRGASYQELVISDEVVPVYGYFMAEGMFYMIMPEKQKDYHGLRYGGVRLNEKTALPVRANTILKLAKGLVEIHDAGISHSDIKPQNVLVDQQAYMAYTDFDRALSKDKESQNFVNASPGYIAPEIMRLIPYNPKKADVFSLGMLGLYIWDDMLAKSFSALLNAWKQLIQPDKYALPSCPDAVDLTPAEVETVLDYLLGDQISRGARRLFSHALCAEKYRDTSAQFLRRLKTFASSASLRRK